MVANIEDLEALLRRSERRFEIVADGTCLVSLGADLPTAALRLAPPVLVVRVEVGPAPEASQSVAVFRKLLELNGGALLHTAYGLDKNTIVLGSALELANLDMNELEAVLADVEMTLAEHVPVLRQLAPKDA